MGTLFFLVMFICLGVVVYWFIQNDKGGGDGALGVLGLRRDDGMTDNEARDGAARYRLRESPDQVKKNAGEKHHVRTLAAEQVQDGEKQRNGFREKTGGAFVSKPSAMSHRDKRRVQPIGRDQGEGDK